MNHLQVGSTLTNGNCAVRLTGPSTGEVAGWLGIYISLGSGQMTGVPCLLEEADLNHWSHVPFEWTVLPEVALEHRYIWTPDCRALRHEIRARPA